MVNEKEPFGYDDELKENEGFDFTPPAADVHNAVLCEFVDLGMQTNPINGKLQPKGILIFQVEETNKQGDRKEVWAYFTKTLGSVEKPSNARTWIKTAWNEGKEFSQEQMPVRIGSYVGRACRAVVSHKTGANGKVRAKLDGLLAPRGTELKPLDYVTYAERMAKKAEREAQNGVTDSARSAAAQQSIPT